MFFLENTEEALYCRQNLHNMLQSKEKANVLLAFQIINGNFHPDLLQANIHPDIQREMLQEANFLDNENKMILAHYFYKLASWFFLPFLSIDLEVYQPHSLGAGNKFLYEALFNASQVVFAKSKVKKIFFHNTDIYFNDVVEKFTSNDLFTSRIVEATMEFSIHKKEV